MTQKNNNRNCPPLCQAEQFKYGNGIEQVQGIAVQKCAIAIANADFREY